MKKQLVRIANLIKDYYAIVENYKPCKEIYDPDTPKLLLRIVTKDDEFIVFDIRPQDIINYRGAHYEYEKELAEQAILFAKTNLINGEK